MELLCVDVWADRACFTQPDSKVERVSYPVPTPSACRGMLNSIYSKPAEFWYEIRKIEVMKPIRYFTEKTNEVTKKMDNRLVPIDTDEFRTQRTTRYLKDVYYRITAVVHIRKDADSRVNEQKIVNEFRRRVESGQCWIQPYCGMSECYAFFDKPNMNMKPINVNGELGLMLYDVFDITDNTPLDTEKGTGELCKAYFYCSMNDGVIVVPRYVDVIRGRDYV